MDSLLSMVLLPALNEAITPDLTNLIIVKRLTPSNFEHWSMLIKSRALILSISVFRMLTDSCVACIATASRLCCLYLLLLH